MSSWHSYPSIYNLGHRYLEELLLAPVLIEEKIDGSQFSFGVIDGVLRAKSKGQELVIDAPEKMFEKAVATVVKLAPMLHEEWTYRGEYLQKPHHNGLAYDRVPHEFVILFDVNSAEESYLPWDEKKIEADRLGLEVVPRLFEGMLQSAEELRHLLDTISILGGQQIEGVVVKNYQHFGADKKALMGKFVSEAYKEVQATAWKITNPSNGDVLDHLIQAYRAPARWNKAVQHLREVGEIDDLPRDIGKIMKEIPEDIMKECEAEIRDNLWRWAWPKIRRGVTHGFPEWYKQRLLDLQFERKKNDG